LSLQESSHQLLDRFLALHPRKIDLSLERIEGLLRKLGYPQRNLAPVIHVAGTNGKGSVVAFMRAMLEAADKSVHVYTSPHLVRFHERIVIGQPGGGAPVDEVELVKALAVCERANAGAPITVFEIITAAALLLFAGAPADYVLLEVGLGGRFDATNVIDAPAASVITPVSLDHAEFLGTQIAQIAHEKAGIIKPGAPVIAGWQTPAALTVIENEAHRADAPLLVAGQDFNCYEQNGRFVYEDGAGLLDLPRPILIGRHQQENAATAIAALRCAIPELPSAAIERGLRTARWPARLQRLPPGPLTALAPDGAEVWLDGGHNEAAARTVAQALAELHERAPRPLVLICGMLASKDARAFLEGFRNVASELIAVPVPGEHASRSAEEMAALARAAGIAATAAPGAEHALRALAMRSQGSPVRILITGSLYLAGEILRLNDAGQA